jgi:hypothetical protein
LVERVIQTFDDAACGHHALADRAKLGEAVQSRPIAPARTAVMPRHIPTRRDLLALAATAALQGCATVPDLDAYRASTDDPLQRHYATQHALSDGPLVFGNQTRLLMGGTQALPAMFRAMDAARDHSNLEYFIFEDVEVEGRRLSDVLIGKLRWDVAVNIIYDAYRSQATPGELFDAVRRAGARVLTYHPINPVTLLQANDRDHRKIMVVDGHIGITGGINLSRTYENPPSAGVPADGDTRYAYWRDTAIEIRVPAVAEFQRLFFATSTRQNGDAVQPAKYFPSLPRQGAQTVRIIGSAPGDGSSNLDRRSIVFNNEVDAHRPRRRYRFPGRGAIATRHGHVTIGHAPDLATSPGRGTTERTASPHLAVLDVASDTSCAQQVHCRAQQHARAGGRHQPSQQPPQHRLRQCMRDRRTDRDPRRQPKGQQRGQSVVDKSCRDIGHARQSRDRQRDRLAKADRQQHRHIQQ